MDQATKDAVAKAEGYQGRAKNLVGAYAQSHLDKSDDIGEFDVYVVWFCYILGGWKALVSTSLLDGMYYEVTYNSKKGETYLDVYKKFDNVCFQDEKPQMIGVHESHNLGYVTSEGIYICTRCMNCACHKIGMLESPCVGKAS
jgi:hypothetical protein